MQTRTLELTVGVFVALGMLALFFLAMQVSNLGAMGRSDGYRVEAHFENIGSLKVRAPVTLAGVRIGRVAAIRVDDKAFEAIATLQIENTQIKIPDDSFAKIYTAGLLGEQYVGVSPGGSPNFLKEGSRLSLTQSALMLEEIIGQFLFNKAGDSKAGETKAEQMR
ncbi:intermembrane phospholipid transport system, substrate binding protein MlaD [Gammaproteobacteria bacterium]